MKKQKKQYILWTAVLLILLVLLVWVIRFGSGYLSNLVFSERQNQLEEVVQQYFDKVDLAMEESWQTALEIKERFVAEDIADIESLKKFFKTEIVLQHLDEKSTGPIAIRADGQYVDKDGWHGTFSYVEPLMDCEDRVSFIYEQPFTGNLFNLYVYKLNKPIAVTDAGHTYSIAFIGVSRNMESMNQYFKCSAYGGDNSTYILDRYGAKQYVDGSAKMNLIKGQNVYTVLRKESEAEGKDFDEILTRLERDGVVYSDIQVSGEACFYAMRKMPNTDYVIVYMNAANLVAMSTQNLVNLVINLFLVIIVVSIVVVITIFAFVTIQNHKQLAKEAQSKQKLLVVNNELDKTNAELKHAMEATQSAFQAAEEANKSKSDFLANMSHDIRTPMNAIIGMTTLIEHNVTSPSKIIEYVDKIKLSSDHLLGLINEVLDMSKIESGKTELNAGVFNINDIISQIETAFKPLTDEKKQKFVSNAPKFAYPWLLGDSIRLTQVLNNILSNAVKYTPVGGKIELEVKENPRKSGGFNKLIFRITDNGIGMSKEYQKHIFESFSREESSVTNKIQGTGLGMAIVKNIVDLMGGTIWVESEQGKGSIFEVSLEFKVEQAPEVEEAARQEKDQEHEVSLDGKRFLCAEDNELNAEILKELLDMSGATCTIYPDGKALVDAFVSVKPGDYDAILMDIQMPVMNGLEATKEIRNSENPLGKAIFIIAMTANAFSSDVQNCLDAGMDAHISKPIDIEVLKKTLYVISRDGGAVRRKYKSN